MTMYRRFVGMEARRVHTVPRQRREGSEEQDDSLPEIHGTAAVYFDENNRAGTQYELWAGHVERILPGAFDLAVKEDDVRALPNHDYRCPLGRTSADTLKLSLESYGLDYVIDTANTTAGRDTVESLDRGDITGSSFQFLPRMDGELNGASWTEEEHEGVTIYVRNLTAVRLFDVGPVTFPAYTATSSGARSFLCLADSRSADGLQELKNLKAEVTDFIRANNYRSEASAKLDELEQSLRDATIDSFLS